MKRRKKEEKLMCTMISSLGIIVIVYTFRLPDNSKIYCLLSPFSDEKIE